MVCRGEWKREGGEPWAQFGIVVRNYVNTSLYFTVYPSSRHNPDTVCKNQYLDYLFCPCGPMELVSTSSSFSTLLCCVFVLTLKLIEQLCVYNWYIFSKARVTSAKLSVSLKYSNAVHHILRFRLNNEFLFTLCHLTSSPVLVND